MVLDFHPTLVCPVLDVAAATVLNLQAATQVSYPAVCWLAHVRTSATCSYAIAVSATCRG